MPGQPVQELPPSQDPDAQSRLLAEEASRSRRRFIEEGQRLGKRCDELREQGASLAAKLAPLRHVVRLADEAACRARERQKRYRRAYPKNPVLHASWHMFEQAQKDIYNYRIYTRRVCYYEVMTHRWSWDKGDDASFNAQVIQALAASFGMKGETEKFLNRVGAVEAFLTDVGLAMIGRDPCAVRSKPEPPDKADD